MQWLPKVEISTRIAHVQVISTIWEICLKHPVGHKFKSYAGHQKAWNFNGSRLSSFLYFMACSTFFWRCSTFLFNPKLFHCYPLDKSRSFAELISCFLWSSYCSFCAFRALAAALRNWIFGGSRIPAEYNVYRMKRKQIKIVPSNAVTFFMATPRIV